MLAIFFSPLLLLTLIFGLDSVQRRRHTALLHFAFKFQSTDLTKPCRHLDLDERTAPQSSVDTINITIQQVLSTITSFTEHITKTASSFHVKFKALSISNIHWLYTLLPILKLANLLSLVKRILSDDG